ncbi:hypothetical protein HDK77DRAFT_136638 [Phyllosticta capitalensis]
MLSSIPFSLNSTPPSPSIVVRVSLAQSLADGKTISSWPPCSTIVSPFQSSVAIANPYRYQAPAPRLGHYLRSISGPFVARRYPLRLPSSSTTSTPTSSSQNSTSRSSHAAASTSSPLWKNTILFCLCSIHHQGLLTNVTSQKLSHELARQSPTSPSIRSLERPGRKHETPTFPPFPTATPHQSPLALQKTYTSKPPSWLQLMALT